MGDILETYLGLMKEGERKGPYVMIHESKNEPIQAVPWIIPREVRRMFDHDFPLDSASGRISARDKGLFCHVSFAFVFACCFCLFLFLFLFSNVTAAASCAAPTAPGGLELRQASHSC